MSSDSNTSNTAPSTTSSSSGPSMFNASDPLLWQKITNFLNGDDDVDKLCDCYSHSKDDKSSTTPDVVDNNRVIDRFVEYLNQFRDPSQPLIEDGTLKLNFYPMNVGGMTDSKKERKAIWHKNYSEDQVEGYNRKRLIHTLENAKSNSTKKAKKEDAQTQEKKE
jgi:hypothetical protein